MLDENINNLDSENLTENTSPNSNPEKDNSKLNKEDTTDTDSKEEVSIETESVIDEVTDKEIATTEEKTVDKESKVEEPVVEEKVINKEAEAVSKKNTTDEIIGEEHTDKTNEKDVEDAIAVAKKNEEQPKIKVVDKESKIEEPVIEEKVINNEIEVVSKKNTTDEIIDEEHTEKTNEKDAEDAIAVTKKNEEQPEIKVDYDSLDLEQLVKEFQLLLKNGTIPAVKNDIEKIKDCFNQKFGELLKEKKTAFLADGGNEIDFQYSNPIKSVYNDLLFEFKTKRQNHYKQLEEEQKENLSNRLTLIEELKHLIDNAEPSTMYSQFKKLQDKWRSIGNIPRTKYNDTWRTYHHHVERFYDLLHLSNDLRDLDFKHNLEEKLKLVVKAEELAEGNDLNKAFKELQVLHRLWKEDIGPVDREHREDIWDRFSNATKKIHEQRHTLQKGLESKYEDNVIIKREVIAKISNLVDDKIDSHKIWQQKIKELETLRQEFFKIGRVPRSVNERVWKEFKDSTRSFNKIKNNFYKNIKEGQHDNLTKKNALVEKAESLKDSEDWDITSEVMKQIQAEWKTIGHVPRKYSDKIWKKFKDACNHYFDRLHGVQDEANKEQVESFNKKKELLENLKSQSDKDESLTLEVINSYVSDWHKLGSLPNNMRHIETKFNKTLNNLYAKLDLDEKEIAMLKFKNIIGNYLSHNNLRKIDNEQLFVRKKIDEITREIQQLENNISFISNADEDNPLLKNVRRNIENHVKQLDVWKTKLQYITSLDY